MKAKSLTLLVALTFPASVWAAPFLVCDPYPSTAPQPTEFVITLTGQTTPIIVPAIPAVPASAGVYLHWDVGTLPPGSKTVTVQARNANGSSAASAPFTFTVVAPAPAVPTGLKLQAD